MMMLLKPGVRWYTPLSVACPALPEKLGQLFEQCLDAAPESRPTAVQLYDALCAASPSRASLSNGAAFDGTSSS